MTFDKFIRLTEDISLFLIGVAVSSTLSYYFGWGDWLGKLGVLFIILVLILSGIRFYLFRKKRATQQS